MPPKKSKATEAPTKRSTRVKSAPVEDEPEPEPVVAKTKPIVKAKKYKQKTYDELIRIEKSKH